MPLRLLRNHAFLPELFAETEGMMGWVIGYLRGRDISSEREKNIYMKGRGEGVGVTKVLFPKTKLNQL